MRTRLSLSLRWMGAWSIGWIAAGTALAQAPAPAPRRAAAAAPRAEVDPEKARKVEALLAQWELKSKEITKLDATFRRVNRDDIWKRVTEFEGRALLQSPNLACLDIKKLDPEDKTKKTFHERIICTGEEVVQYDGSTRQIIVYPLPQQERQRALQEGPLPFLFDMKSEEVKRRYEIHLLADSPKVYRLRIVPLEDVDRDAFSEAIIDLNKLTFLPDALQLHAPSGKETQTYIFTSIAKNVAIEPKNFQRLTIPGWKVVVNPDGQGRPRPPGAPDDPRQPAMRSRPGTRPR